MSQASRSSKKTAIIAVVTVVVVGIVLFLSNRTVNLPNGQPVIFNDDSYRNELDQAVKLSQDGVSNFDLGKELTPEQKKNLAQAAIDFDAIDTYKPTESAGYFEAGLCYYLSGDTDTALNRVTQSLYNSVTTPKLTTAADRTNLEGVIGDCHHLLSLISFDKHDYQRAIDESSEAVKHRQDRPLYYVARARAEAEMYSMQQQADKDKPADPALIENAKKDLAAAYKIYPGFPPAKQLEGLIK